MYAKVKCEYLNIKQLRVKQVVILHAFQRSIHYCQVEKKKDQAENHFVAVMVPLLAIVLLHLHKTYIEYHANHTQIFLTSEAHEPLYQAQRTEQPMDKESTKWGRLTLIYTWVYIYQFTLFLSPVKASERGHLG